MKLTTHYNLVRLLIKIVFLSFMLLAVLGKHTALFAGRFYLREWIWYLMGLSAIILITCRRDFVRFIKKDKGDQTAGTDMLESLLLFIVFAMLWLRYAPGVEADDEAYFLRNSYKRFEEMHRIKTFLLRNNPGIGKAIFTNTTKIFRWETQDSAGNVTGFNQSLGEQSDLIASTIQSFTNDFQISGIVLDREEVRFYFRGYHTPVLVRSDLAKPKVAYTAGNYFIEAAKEE